jgi:hypothetical protein
MCLNLAESGMHELDLPMRTAKRRNIKRTAGSKAEASQIVKDLVSKLDDDGKEAAIGFHLTTFNDLADYYEYHYAKPVVIVDGANFEGRIPPAFENGIVF